MLEESKPRNVVPRWRSSTTTASTNEANFGAVKSKVDYSADLVQSDAEFTLTPSVPIASELMFLANEAGVPELTQKAAKFILSQEELIGSSSLLQFAKKNSGLNLNENQTQLKTGAEFLKEARQLLSLEYRNPVLLIDAARELTSLGHHQSALRYVKAAISLAPTSRFIVRSTARYFLHIGDYDQAHEILRRSPNIKIDPWIQASELAVATIRNKPSMLSKQSFRSLLEAKHIGPDRAELASAVATMELKSGSNKNAKLLFNKALFNPNDNSLAQAEWAAEKLKLVVDERALKTPLSFEANSNNAYRRLEVGQAIAHAQNWASDEPFASRPFDSLSYLYCLEDDYVNALKSTERAIRIEESEKLALHLNRLFAKIQLGEIDDSYSELLRLSKHTDAKAHAIHLLADYGALAYSTGDISQGRLFYERSIELARKRHDTHSEGQALAYFARAAIAHNDPKGMEILDRANKQVVKLPSHGAIYVVSRLVSEEKRKVLVEAATARIQKREWSWDSASNTLRMLE
jgi:tetratricopeptide (TPR) repeat protein